MVDGARFDDVDDEGSADIAAEELTSKQPAGTAEDYLLIADEQQDTKKTKRSAAKPANKPAKASKRKTTKKTVKQPAKSAKKTAAQGPAPKSKPAAPSRANAHAAGAAPPAPKKRMFPALSYKSFAYPQDDETLEAVKRIPGVTKLFDWIIDNLLEEYLALNHLYNATRVDAKQYPSLWNTVRKCCKILDCPVPDVYISFNIGFNAMTSGVDRTFLMIGSRVVDIFPPEDQLFMIGHELGHIKANHVLYKTVTRFIVEFLPVLQSMIPINVGMLYRPMLLALAEWDRRSEFTSDRAGLLCCQNLDAATNALAWFSGRLRRRENEYSRQVLSDQIADVQLSKNQLARLMLFLSSIQNTHPYSVLRISELTKWRESGAYDEILKGNYVRDVLGEHEAGRRRICAGCRREVNVKLDFCPYCGAAMRGKPVSAAAAAGPVCAKCGATLAKDAKFCTKCGAAISD